MTTLEVFPWLRLNQTLLRYFKFILCGHFAVKNTTFKGFMMSRKKSKGGGVIATQPVFFNGKKHNNEVFMFDWANTSKVCTLFYLFWWKPCLDVLSHLSQPRKYIFWSQKWRRHLILTIFDNFRYFWHEIVYDVTVTSFMGCWYLFGING